MRPMRDMDDKHAKLMSSTTYRSSLDRSGDFSLTDKVGGVVVRLDEEAEAAEVTDDAAHLSKVGHLWNRTAAAFQDISTES